MTLPGFMPCPDYHLTPAGNRNPSACPGCEGAGQIPDPDTAEAVARVLIDGDEFTPPWDEALDPLKAWYRAQARAALLAYARYVKEKP